MHEISLVIAQLQLVQVILDASPEELKSESTKKRLAAVLAQAKADLDAGTKSLIGQAGGGGEI